MLYRKNPKNGEDISILGYGAMRLPQKGIKINYEVARKQLLHCIEKGVNYLDTAWPYHNGESEKFLGKVLAEENLRDKVKLADKLPPWIVDNREKMDIILEKQLERLQTNYIDYYLVHALDGQSWDKMTNLNIKDFLQKIKVSGKVINVGFSFHGDQKDFMRIVDDYDWDFCQIQYNILDENNQAGTKGLKYATQKGLGIIIMEPLRGGNLAQEMPKEAKIIYNSATHKRTNVEWALRWIWNHPEVTCVLSGMNNMDHIEENLRIAEEALPNSLTEKELSLVEGVAKAYKKAMKTPCTACQYCMPCPFGVDIPANFSLHNSYHMFGKKITDKGMYYMTVAGLTGGKKKSASLCKQCGKCVPHCPQKINIPKELKKVEKDMEGFFTKMVMKLVSKIFKRMGKSELEP